MAAAVFVAELVMILVAKYAGGKADSWGRKPLFLTALCGVLLTLVTADLGKGAGRFNFLQGSIQSAMGLGGFLSNSAFGYVARRAGFNARFAGLSAAAVAGGLLYQLRMPETRGDNPQ